MECNICGYPRGSVHVCVPTPSPTKDILKEKIQELVDYASDHFGDDVLLSSTTDEILELVESARLEGRREAIEEIKRRFIVPNGYAIATKYGGDGTSHYDEKFAEIVKNSLDNFLASLSQEEEK